MTLKEEETQTSLEGDEKIYFPFSIVERTSKPTMLTEEGRNNEGKRRTGN
jgi:hypothetical protein